MRLIAFPFHDWRKAQSEGVRTRDLHVLDWLSRHSAIERILVIDRPVSLAERLARRDGWHVTGTEVARRGSAARHAVIHDVGGRTFVLDQRSASVLRPIIKRRGWWFDAFESHDTDRAIAWAIDELGPFDGCIAWQPAVAPALAALRQPYVYDSLDNWLIHPAFATWSRKSERAYGQILPAAQAVFVSAPASREVLLRWRTDIEIVPNGVDVETFERDAPRPSDMPDSYVVGYVGKIARRIDADLVVAVAQSMPEVNFVMMGPVLEPHVATAMRTVSNIRLLGDRHYAMLPAYVRSFDVAWIPHRVGAGETGGDPIKLYEYWAAGKPVVSTRIDGMAGWADRVLLVDDAASAIAAISGLLRGDINLAPAAVPPERTWQSITDRLVAPLLELIVPPGRRGWSAA